MSALLQDVLKSSTIPDDTNPNERDSGSHSDDDDEELVNVVSEPGTPQRTRPSSPQRTRPISPSPHEQSSHGHAQRSTLRSSSLRPSSKIQKDKAHDPLRILPTEVNQKIFGSLSMKELAKCSLVSRKWLKSQTLNYVWFQHYRKENFNDESLPPGKWTKRESKQSWRSTNLASLKAVADQIAGISSPGTLASISNNLVFTSSGYQTPREMKEEKWRQEADHSNVTITKNEKREQYKEMGGRKVKGKGGRETRGVKDRAGFSEDGMWGD